VSAPAGAVERAAGLGIEVRAAAVRFGAVEALARASVDLAPGKFLSIVGDSGGGKTTLLRAIGGLLPLSAGSIVFRDAQGQAVRPGSRDIGFCFQEGRLLPWRSVLANVALPLELEGVPRAERLRAAAAMLDRMRLSGVERPRLLLLDEPFGALDEVTRQALDEELLALVRAAGTTAVLVTHSIQEAVLLADQVLVLRGRPGVSQAPIAVGLTARDEAVRLSVPFASLCAQVQSSLREGRAA
jgi:NitT/TauT family transport system ATP-binding protein